MRSIWHLKDKKTVRSTGNFWNFNDSDMDTNHRRQLLHDQLTLHKKQQKGLEANLIARHTLAITVRLDKTCRQVPCQTTCSHQKWRQSMLSALTTTVCRIFGSRRANLQLEYALSGQTRGSSAKNH